MKLQVMFLCFLGLTVGANLDQLLEETDKMHDLVNELQQERDMPMLEELAQHINRFHEDHLEPIQDPNLGYDDYPIGFDDMYDYDGALEDVVEGDKEEEYFM